MLASSFVAMPQQTTALDLVQAGDCLAAFGLTDLKDVTGTKDPTGTTWENYAAQCEPLLSKGVCPSFKKFTRGRLSLVAGPPVNVRPIKAKPAEPRWAAFNKYRRSLVIGVKVSTE
eukprot:g11536.t1